MAEPTSNPGDRTYTTSAAAKYIVGRKTAADELRKDKTDAENRAKFTRAQLKTTTSKRDAAERAHEKIKANHERVSAVQKKFENLKGYFSKRKTDADSLVDESRNMSIDIMKLTRSLGSVGVSRAELASVNIDLVKDEIITPNGQEGGAAPGDGQSKKWSAPMSDAAKQAFESGTKCLGSCSTALKSSFAAYVEAVRIRNRGKLMFEQVSKLKDDLDQLESQLSRERGLASTKLESLKVQEKDLKADVEKLDRKAKEAVDASREADAEWQAAKAGASYAYQAQVAVAG